MSGALGALRRSLTQAPKLTRSVKTSNAARAGHADVSFDLVPLASLSSLDSIFCWSLQAPRAVSSWPCGLCCVFHPSGRPSDLYWEHQRLSYYVQEPHYIHAEHMYETWNVSSKLAALPIHTQVQHVLWATRRGLTCEDSAALPMCACFGACHQSACAYARLRCLSSEQNDHTSKCACRSRTNS